MRLVDGTYTEVLDNSPEIVRAMVAGAAPMYPPKSWFENPGFDRPTPITITADGHISGHIADWNTDHIGLPPGTRAPRSNHDYAFFKTGVVVTQEGDEVPIGNLTLSGGHAPLNASAGEAVEHYDNTASAVADIVAGEDAHGIYVNGGLRPGVSEEQIRALRASAPSGDWRPINGHLELVAVCQVNTPGFPQARSIVAGGQMTALVACGAARMAELQQERNVFAALHSLEDKVDDLSAVVAAAPQFKKGAPKSDNSSDSEGDDSTNQEEPGDNNAGKPTDDNAKEAKADTTHVDNKDETHSNKGKTPPRKPKLPSKKTSVTASAKPRKPQLPGSAKKA